MAKDSAGNEDPTPSTRSFTVDTSPPLPGANFRAVSTSIGVKLDWSHSSSSDINSYRLYWDNGTGTINYSAPFATVNYPRNSFTASIQREGTYRFGVRALDRAGNEEKNLNVVATIAISGFNVTANLAAQSTTAAKMFQSLGR